MHDPDGWITPGRESLLIGTTSKRMLSACTARKGPDSEPPAHLWISEKFSLVSSQVDTDEEPEMFGAFAHLTEKTELVDGVFPNWRRVMPSKRRTEVEPFPCLNGEYLEVFNRIGVLLSGQKHFGGGGLRLEPSEGTGSVVVRLNSHDLIDRFLGVVMPMHSDPVAKLLPEWASSEEEESKAA